MKKKRAAYSNFHAELTCEFDPSFLESQFRLDFEKVLENVGMPKSIKRDKLAAEFASQAAKIFDITLESHLNLALNSCVWLIVAQVLQADITPDKPRSFSGAVEIYLNEHLKELRRLAATRGKGRPPDPLLEYTRHQKDASLLEDIKIRISKQIEDASSWKLTQQSIADVVPGLGSDKAVRALFSRLGIRWEDWKEEFLNTIGH